MATDFPTRMYKFDPPLGEGVVVSRPNRFVMLVKIGGRTVRCHCPTTGRLGDADLRGIACLVSKAKNTARKMSYTVEAISLRNACKRGRKWIGINQTAVNRYVEHFLRNKQLSKLARGELRREVRLEASRIDFSVGGTLIEVKMPLIALPSNPGTRKVKHGRFNSFDRLIRHTSELANSIDHGKRAVVAVCYIYDAEPFRPPPRNEYNSRILDVARWAEERGVQTWQLNFKVDRSGVRLLGYFRNRLFT